MEAVCWKGFPCGWLAGEPSCFSIFSISPELSFWGHCFSSEKGLYEGVSLGAGILIASWAKEAGSRRPFRLLFLVWRLTPELFIRLSSVNPDLCGTEGGGVAWVCQGRREHEGLMFHCRVCSSPPHLTPTCSVFDAPEPQRDSVKLTLWHLISLPSGGTCLSFLHCAWVSRHACLLDTAFTDNSLTSLIPFVLVG